MQTKPYLLTLFLLICLGSCSLEHKYAKYKNTFEREIQKLEQLTDDTYKNDYLLFIGSSSIRRWDTIEEDMSPFSVVKLGYGGAHYYDLIHYVERLVKNKEKAKAVILFVANDITGSISKNSLHSDLTPNKIKKLFKAISQKIHKNLSHDVPIYVIETTPTPSRWKVWHQIEIANDLIQSYTETKTNLHFIPTRAAFLNQRGLPIGKYFVKDSLHLSKAGYDLWGEIIKKKLEQMYSNMKNKHS